MDGSDAGTGESWGDALRPATTLLAVVTAATLGFTATVTVAARLRGGSSAVAPVLDARRAAAWSGPRWFHGRPTAATGGVSGGSNLGPGNPALAAAVAERVAAIRAENPAHEGPIPVDLVTTSASGLDPHVSPPAAFLQVARVAAATGLPEAEVRGLVEQAIEPRSLGVFGQPRVNVVELNARLESLAAGAGGAERGAPP